MSASGADRFPRLPEWAQVTATRRAHIRRVAGLLDQWAQALTLKAAERDRWLRAAILHDALKDAPAELVASLAQPRLGPPALWHGPAAAQRAEADGERDAGVLAAVRYHSVGYADWDWTGRMLYLADYLDPGRHFADDTRRAWAVRMPKDRDAVLREVTRARIERGLRKGWPLLAETAGFWNSLR
jgi:HD superfamily phosphohydrolase YqeK